MDTSSSTPPNNHTSSSRYSGFPSYQLYGARVQQQRYTTDGDRHNNIHLQADMQAYFDAACPSESILHSCYFRNDLDSVTRAKQLEERWFHPTHTDSCPQYDPMKFLQRLRHRRLILIGDSVMAQIFSSLVCSLYKLTLSTYEMGFETLDRGKCTPITCPYNRANHSHLDHGWMNFPMYNASIILLSGYEYHIRISYYLCKTSFGYICYPVESI